MAIILRRVVIRVNGDKNRRAFGRRCANNCAVVLKRSFRDPDLIPRHHEREEHLGQVGYWPAGEREKMDQQFAAAMQAAGYGTTAPSTHFGTRAPIAGYRRTE
jgi:hypothetical protein